MATRITRHDLDNLVRYLNDELPDHDFAIDGAYGGVKLTSHSGSRDVSTIGFGTKRELYEWIHAFRAGLYARETAKA